MYQSEYRTRPSYQYLEPIPKLLEIRSSLTWALLVVLKHLIGSLTGLSSPQNIPRAKRLLDVVVSRRFFLAVVGGATSHSLQVTLSQPGSLATTGSGIVSVCLEFRGFGIGS